jgi:WD40 repeat protein
MKPLLVLALLALRPQDAPALPPSRTVGEHESAILQLAVSPDGEVLVTASKEELWAYDLGKDEALWTTSFRAGFPAPVTLSVGEELVAFHRGSAVAQLHELENGIERTGVGGTTAMLSSRCLVLDAEDRWLWIGTDKGVVSRVVPDNVSSWSNRDLENGGVTCLALDGKGKTLAVGGRDATVRFVGAKSANPDDKKVLEGHPKPVSAVAMDAKGALVVSGSEAGDVRVWKFSSGKEQHVLDRHAAAVTRLAIDPNGKLLASGDEEGAVHVWDLKKGEHLLQLADHAGGVTGLAFVGKGETLATSGGGAQVTVWDLSEL